MADHELISSDASEKEKAIDALRKEGVEVFFEEVGISDAVSKGYKRVPSDIAGRIDAAFQFAPQAAVNQINKAAVEKSFQEAVEGSYRVKLDPGIHLGKSHKNVGAFSANTFDAENGMKGPTDLFVNDAVLNVSNVPQIVLNVFNAASFVTGQYFMAEVNEKLATIQDGINQLLQLLDMEQASELESAIKSLQNMVDHRFYIQSSPVRIQAAIIQLHGFQEQARKTISYSKKAIQLEQSKINLKKDKDEVIDAHIHEIAKHMSRYQQAVQLLGVSTVLEVLLANITDKDELSQFQGELESVISVYTNDCAACKNWSYDYLNTAKGINQLTWWQYTKMGLAGAVGGAAGGWRGGIFKAIGGAAAGASGSYVIMNEHRKERKKALVALADESYERLESAPALEAPTTALKQYQQCLQKPSEFIRIGNELYTNIPIAES